MKPMAILEEDRTYLVPSFVIYVIRYSPESVIIALRLLLLQACNRGSEHSLLVHIFHVRHCI